jgi:hypothetical protein
MGSRQAGLVMASSIAAFFAALNLIVINQLRDGKRGIYAGWIAGLQSGF